MKPTHYRKVFILTLFVFGVPQLSFGQQSYGASTGTRLSSILSYPKEDELLEPEQAFKMKASFKDATTLVAEITPANGYYLYKDKIHFTVKDSPGVSIQMVKMPTGEIKTDQIFGKSETFKNPVLAENVLTRSPQAKTVTLAAGYQGCHEKSGVCYPPIDKSLKLSLP